MDRLDDTPAHVTAEVVRALEAILMVADTPVDVNLLAQITEVPSAQIEQVLSELSASYEVDGRGFVLVNVAGGWRFQSHPDMAPYVERFVLEGQSSRLSAAALETLAIIAYKQPISRAQVAAIRGVNVDGVVRTLEQRGYIAEVARDPGPGNAVLFGTTQKFLERMGINSIEDLPPIADFIPSAEVVEALEHGLRADAPEADAPQRHMPAAGAAEPVGSDGSGASPGPRPHDVSFPADAT
ncbi:MAG: SMC-Scp complex subunit ScpB [Acidimicrobiales bacterium]|nr:SMC-Scp complex subunit ScpB [Acidimicrobiales bacterium]